MFKLIKIHFLFILTALNIVAFAGETASHNKNKVQLNSKPLVYIVGSYAEKYSKTLDESGCELRKLSEEEFKNFATLKKPNALILANCNKGINGTVEKQIYDYVKNGGSVLFTLNSVPHHYFLPGTTFFDGRTMDVKTDPKNPLAFPERLYYGVWGIGMKLKPGSKVQVLGRWHEYRKRLHKSKEFKAGDPAIVIAKIGKGRMIYSGIALCFASPEAFRSVLRWLLPGIPDFSLFKKALACKTRALMSNENCSKTVAVFKEKGFPTVALPKSVTADYIARVLRKADMKTIFVSAADLADADKFNPQKFGVLIVSSGEAFPLNAYANLRSFARRGGAVVFPAGLPLTVPCHFSAGRWQPVFPAECRGTLINMLFTAKVIPAAKYYAPIQGSSINSLSKAIPANLFSSRSASSVQEVLLPNSRFCEPLAVALNEAGEVCSIPLTLQYFSKQAPAARYVFCNFRGENHPWNPAFANSEKLIAKTVEAAARKYSIIADVFTDLPCYKPGENAKINVIVRSNKKVNTELLLAVYKLGSKKPIKVYRRELAINSGEKQTVFNHTILEGGRYNIIASLNGETYRAGLIAYPGKVGFRQKTFGFADGGATIDGKECWISGVNLYCQNFRSPGIFFNRLTHSQAYRHPVPQQWFEDLSLVRLCGGNAIRQHYLEYILNAKKLSGYSYERRLLDAFLLATAEAGVIDFVDPVTFHYCMKPKNAGNSKREQLMELPENLRSMEAYLKKLGEVTKPYKNIAWEIINEPDLLGEKLKKEAQVIKLATQARKVLRKGIEALQGDRKFPVGIGNAHTPMNFVWNKRDNLDYLNWTNTHYYGHVTNETKRKPAFGMNFGYPSLLGEFGQPGGNFATDAKLGNWQDEYGKILALTFAERGIGFLNFYLAQRAGAITSPEWGFLRQDMTETSGFKVWKKFNYLLKHLPRKQYLRPDEFLIYNARQLYKDPQFIGKIASAYQILISNGVHCRLVNEKELPQLKSMCRRAFVLSEKAPALPVSCQTVMVRDLEALKKFSNPALPHKNFDWAYWLRRKDGGRTLVLAGACKNGDSAFKYKHNAYKFTASVGDSLVLNMDENGAPTALFASGSVYCNGKLLAKGTGTPYVLLAKDGVSMFKSQNVRLFADVPLQIKSKLKLENDISNIKSFYIKNSSKYTADISCLKSDLSKRGIAESASADNADLIITIHNASKNLLDYGGTGKALLVNKQLLYFPWSGLIKVKKDDQGKGQIKVNVCGVTDVGVTAALKRLAVSKSLKSCLVGPYMPLD